MLYTGSRLFKTSVTICLIIAILATPLRGVVPQVHSQDVTPPAPPDASTPSEPPTVPPPTVTETSTVPSTATETPSQTQTETPTATETATPTETSTATATDTLTDTATPIPTDSPSPMVTTSPTETTTVEPPVTWTETPTPPNETPAVTSSPSPTLEGPAILLSETGEFDAGLWQLGGSWSRSNVEAAHSGSWLFSDSPGTAYSPNTTASLNLAQPFSLPSTAQIELQYWQWLDLAGGDSVQTQLSTDNLNWVTIASENTIRNLGWTVRTVNLSGYAGQSLWIRFVLTTDEDPTTVGDGWWLDDITVRADPLPVTPRTGLSTLESDEPALWLTEGNWQSTTAAVYSGSLAWTSIPQPETIVALTLNTTISLASLTQPELRFWQLLDLATGVDSAQVQLSTDGGQTWFSLATYSAADNAAMWTEKVVSLATYAGQTIRVRFLLTTDNDGLSGAGWTVDAISLQSAGSPSVTNTPTPTVDLTATPTEDISGWITYEDTDPLLVYDNGTWQTFEVTGAIGGNLTGSADPGATLTAYFEGTGIRVIYSQGPEGGTFTAQVDDGTPQTGNSAGTEYSYGHVLALEGLSEGQHVLTVTNGDGAIWIEASQIQGQLLSELVPTATLTPTLTPTVDPSWITYEDTDPLLVYGDGTWQTFEVTGAVGGNLTGSADPGATLTAYFEGTGIRVIYAKGPEGGPFSGQVDNGTAQTADSYGDSASYGSVLAFEALPEGEHTLTITNGDGAIWIEAIAVQGELIPAALIDIPTMLEGSPDYFFEDFENGVDQWELTGYWDTNDTQFHSGTWSVRHARGTDYTAYIDLLTLHDPIALPAGSTPYLTYWSRYKLSVNERALVQVSTDDGVSWTTVETYFEVTDLTWKPRRIDLSGYQGQAIRLRFVFVATACTSDCVPNTSWWIDDVKVYEFPPDALNEGFESGTELWTLTGRWARLSAQHHTGSWAMQILRGTDYSAFTERLTLNDPLDLSEFVAPLLTYWTKYKLSSYETIEVQVYVVGTGPWTTIQTISNVTNTAWISQQIDLSPYIGQSIQLRFVFKATACSSGCTANTMWWIDDVTVAEQPAPTATLPPLADLAVASVDSSGMVVDGQTLEVSGTVSAEITNRGEGPALADFTLTVYEDRNTNGTYEPETDNTLGTTSQSLLAPGETVPVTVPVAGSVLFAGNVVYAFVDSANVIPESNETNNINHTGGAQPGDFAPTLEWEWTGSSVLPESNQVMMAPAVVDLDLDGMPDIVFASFQGSNYISNGHLRAIHGDGSGEFFTVIHEDYDVSGGASVAVGNIDTDGNPEILIGDESGVKLLAFEHDGYFKWRSPEIAGGVNRGAPAIADLDHDGTPEVIIGATVLNAADGTRRWEGIYGTGGGSNGPLSLAADLDMSGTVEVVAGNTAYYADGVPYWTNGDVPDGYNAIGDLDLDGFPEVVVVGNGALYLLEHDGTLKWEPVSIPGGGGGAPIVADVDGDGLPEIGVAGKNRYAVFEEVDHTLNLKWAKATQDISSERTGSSVFDFEGDGSVEIVYGDEEYLRVYRGLDGTVLWSTPSSSKTTRELPIIVDVDADGHAEIVKVSNNYAGGSQYGVQVYGDTNDYWMSTREIWNQHTYHITNVNADGSIPMYEANNWEIYNNYRQASALPDLTASYVHRADGAEGITLTARIGNGGGMFVPAGVSVAYYNGDPAAGGTLLGTTTTSIRLDPGAYTDVALLVPLDTLASPVWVVADDTGGLVGQHTELDETNNRYRSTVYLLPPTNAPPVVDAGPDQTITLPTDTLTLNGSVSDDGLPSGTLTLTWSQVSGPVQAVISDPTIEDLTVTVTEPGEYIFRLTADDQEYQVSDTVEIIVISNLPGDVVCYDWRQEDAFGWIDSSPERVVWDEMGMYATGDATTASAYYTLPDAGPWSMLFTGNGVGTIVVAQGAAAPEPGVLLEQPISLEESGAYLLTQPVVQLQWPVDGPFDPAHTTVFQAFCYGPVPANSNQPPEITMGEDLAFSLQPDVPLDVTVTDDGLPNHTLTLTWSQVSGPIEADISDPSIEDPTITVTEPGTYVLNLLASDGELATEDQITLTVYPLADLAVSSMDISGMVVDGQTLEVSGTVSAGIENLGEGPTLADFALTIFEDRNANGTYEPETDSTLGMATQTPLMPSQTADVLVPVTGSVLFAGNIVYAFVDNSNVIPESDETNNTNHTGGECVLLSTPGSFSPELEWEWPQGDTTLSNYNLVVMAPIVVDLDLNGTPDLVFSSFAGSDYKQNGKLRAVRGDGSGEMFTITGTNNDGESLEVDAEANIAAGDLDADGYPEIVALHETRNRLIAFEHDGSFKWLSPSFNTGTTTSESRNSGGPAIADLDADGFPEIVLGRTVLEGTTGDILWTGSYGMGSNGRGPMALVADLNLDGIPEIVAGNTAYVFGDDEPYWTNSSVGDGYNAVADFDADGYPEVVLVSYGQIYLLEHDGTLKWGPITHPGGGRSGPPTIADVDGDGQVEIGVAGGNRYVVFETDGKLKWQMVTDDNSSGHTGSSVFDFEGDGAVEVIYGDEHYLRVYRGTTGDELWYTASSSSTTSELPLVVDVDGDGNAEIVKVSNNYEWGGQHGVQVYGDANDNWVRTREIWNQHTYHITNVNADGSIPTIETNNWEIYNNYRQNICDSARPDLTASYGRRVEAPDGITLTARIGNGGGIFVPPGVSVAFYAGDPRQSGSLLLGTTLTTTQLQPSQFEDISLGVPVETVALPVWIVADDQGDLQGQYTELDESNNLHQSAVYLNTVTNTPPVVNAGDDQTITLPNDTLTLSGSATDDELPVDNLTHIWRLVDGPGTVSFADAHELETTVTLTEPGEYVFRLTANDQEYRVSDTVTVTVISTTPPLCKPSTLDDFIDKPENEEHVKGRVPVVLDANTNLQHMRVDYWQVNNPNGFKILAENVAGTGGVTVATFDTTLLANDSYVICAIGQNSAGQWESSAVMVTVKGEYKPGRVRFSVTDLVVPLTGLPISIGRTYDSLERENNGDFGYGWTLDVASPRVEVDPKNNVTLTMPDGKRSTFYFDPYVPSGIFGFLLVPKYTAESGVYGSLESDGCKLLTITKGKIFCFPGGQYSKTVTKFTYTDPYGRVFEIDIDEGLKSILDLNGNKLEFADNGITSSPSGVYVPFERDEQGRIIKITDPMDNEYVYQYDAAGDLVAVDLPDTTTNVQYDYEDAPELAHLFKSGTDPNGHIVATATYYPDGEMKGRLEKVTDALGYDTSYAYDLNAHTTTITNPTPDGGTVELTYDEAVGGKLVREKVQVTASPVPEYRITEYHYDPTTYNLLEEVVDPNGLNLTARYTYNDKGQRTSITNPLGVTVITATYNKYGGPETISGPAVLVEDASGNLVSRRSVIQVAYDSTFMPRDITDTLGYIGGYTWDSHGNPLTQKDGEGQATSFAYDAYGNVKEQSDPLGRTTKFDYDDLGRQTSRTEPCEPNPLGCRTDNLYDALGRLEQTTDPLGNVTRYEYDVNGNRTTVIQILDGVELRTSYAYDEANQLTDVTNPQGMVTHYEYDSMGRQVKVITNYVDGVYDSDHPDVDVIREMKYDLAGQLLEEKMASCCGSGEVTSYAYDSAGRQVSGTTQGVTTTYVYDAAGRVIQERDPLNHTVFYTYNDAGQLTSRKDQNLQVTEYRYDVRGRLVRILNPDGSQIAYTYDLAGRQTNITELNGTVTHQSYNAAGQLIEVIQAQGIAGFEAITRYEYDLETGLQTEVIDTLGHHTRFTYDDLGRQIQVVENYINGTFDSAYPDQDVSRSMAYDDLGRLTDVTDANSTVTHFVYNAVGQRTQTVTNYNGLYDPKNLTETIGYDGAGRQKTSTDPKGLTTAYAYDDAGHLHSVTNAEEETTTYLYDSYGRLHIMRDANGHDITYTYDVLGRQVQKTWPGGSYERYTYDAVGNLITHRLTDGKSNTFSYDAMNRLKTARYFDGQTISYIYTASGQVRTVQDARGSVTYTYDSLDRPTSVVYGGQSISYSYDAAGNRQTMTTPADTISYDYDGLNRLSLVSATSGQTTYTYDPVGLLMQVGLPNSITTTYGYDGAYRPTSIVHSRSGQTLDSYAYTYDAAGNRTQVTEHGSTVISWQYDNAYRLLSEARNGSITSYTYGDTGNRLSMTEGGVTTRYVYNALDQLLCTTTGTTCSSGVLTRYTYDKRGNLHTESDGTTTTTYTFDARDYLTGVTDGSTTTAYTYDAGGRRISENLNGTLTKYRWDEFSPYGDIVVETNSTNAITGSYVLGDGRLISQTHGSATRYYLTDVQGSVRALTNAAGTVGQTYDYAAFGDLRQTIPDPVSDYLYTGQRYDATTEQYYLRAREYDPVVGRFLSRDTWAVDTWNPLELNRYVYAAANPTRFYDPTGYMGFDYSKMQEEVAKLIEPLRVGGQTLQYVNVRIGLNILKWAPWFQHGACLIVGFTTDADLGPTCDVLPDTGDVGEIVGGIYKAIDRNHFGTQLMRFVRETAKLLVGGNKNAGNLAFTRYSLDGIFRNRAVWGLSQGQDTGKLRKFIEDLGETVAPAAIGRYETLPINHMGEIDDINGWNRIVDAETQTFEYIADQLDKLEDSGVNLHGLKLYVELLTERAPCPSCVGVAKQFIDEQLQRGLDVEVHIISTK